MANSDPILTVVTLVNNTQLYSKMRDSLSAQHPDGFIQWIPVSADVRKWNAAQGLNYGLSEAAAPWVVCVHQDVCFPKGWWEDAYRQIEAWPGRVGVVGLVGVRANGKFVGHVFDPHGHCRWLPMPATVCSVDEHVIIVRRSAGIRFDPANPSFHCYGTDIALQAQQQGLDVVVVDAPVIHLSGGKLDGSFETSAQWLIKKWGISMKNVIPTCAMTINTPSLSNLVRRLRVRFNRRHSGLKRHCNCPMFRS